MDEIQRLNNVYVNYLIYNFKEYYTLFYIHSRHLSRKFCKMLEDEIIIPQISLMVFYNTQVKIEPLPTNSVSGIFYSIASTRQDMFSLSYSPIRYDEDLILSDSSWVLNEKDLISLIKSSLEKINVTCFKNKLRVTLSFGKKLKKDKTFVHEVIKISNDSNKPGIHTQKVIFGRNIHIDKNTKTITYSLFSLTDNPMYILVSPCETSLLIDSMPLYFYNQRHAFKFRTEPEMNKFIEYLNELNEKLGIFIFNWR